MSKKITIWHNGVKKMSFVITEEQHYDNTPSADDLVQSLVHVSQSFCSGLFCEAEDLRITDYDKVIACVRDEKEHKLAQIQNEQDKRQLEIQL